LGHGPGPARGGGAAGPLVWAPPASPRLLPAPQRSLIVVVVVPVFEIDHDLPADEALDLEIIDPPTTDQDILVAVVPAVEVVDAARAVQAVSAVLAEQVVVAVAAVERVVAAAAHEPVPVLVAAGEPVVVAG